MVTKFIIQNFKSIRDRIEINFVSPFSRSSVFRENTIYSYSDKGKKCVLDSLVIYGANGAGKSNVINAINYFKDIVVSGFSQTNSQLDKYSNGLLGFRFSEEDKSKTSFEIELIQKVDNNDYLINYTVSINNPKLNISYEKLSFRKISKNSLSDERIIYLRDGNSIEFQSDHTAGVVDYVIKGNIWERILLNLINTEINEDAFKFEVSTLEYKIARKVFEEISGIFISSPQEKIPLTVLKRIMNDNDFKISLLNALKDIDISIEDIEAEDLGFINEFFTVSETTAPYPKIARRNIFIRTFHNVNGQKYSLSIQNESQGTKKFIQDFLMIYSSLLLGNLFVSDEFSNAYHPLIQDYIISKFKSEGNKNKAQLLITTHDLHLLDQTRFAKEQILIAVKDRVHQTTSIEALSQYRDLSYNNHNWKNLYMEGRFEGIPEVYY